MVKHYENLKIEMMIDARELSEQNKIKNLETIAASLEKRLARIINENEIISTDTKTQGDDYAALKQLNNDLIDEMNRLEVQERDTDHQTKEQIKELILQNEKMKQEEIAFKESCTRNIEELHKMIEEAETLADMPDDNSNEFDEDLQKENETLGLCRLQLAKRNRTVISLQRQIDNIPDNTELAQYQKRFFELYNNMGFKHKETKQFYALFNTLNDTHLYLEKELMLLNNIYDNYSQ